MPLSGSAARRYAEALLEIAAREKAVDAYRASLDRIGNALGPDLIAVLRNPRVPLERRRAAVEAATGAEPRAVRAVIDLLMERDRIALLPVIARAYGELVDAREGIVKARITTPVQLREPERADLVHRLEESSGQTVRATFAVDPSLIGGAKIQIGDRLIDASLQTQLNEMARQLAS